MPLSWVNNNSGTAAGSGALLRAALGAELTAAASITITDSVHVVSGSATITTITTTSAVPVLLVLIPKAASTWSLGTGGNITGIASSVAATADRPFLLVWDGTTSWRVEGSVSLDYVQKAGDTMSGALLVGSGAANPYNAMLVLDNGSATGPSVFHAGKASAGQRPITINNGAASNILFNAWRDASAFKNATASEYAGGLRFTGSTGALSLVVATSAPGTADQTITLSDRLSIAAATGDVTLSAKLFERARTTAVGEWVTPTFAAGDFTASGSMTWTVAAGDVTTYAYTLVGKTMTVAWQIVTSTVGGVVSSALRIAIPGGAVAAKTMVNPILYNDNLTGGTIGYAEVTAAGTVIGLFKPTAANWTLSTDQTYVYGQITFEIQ